MQRLPSEIADIADEASLGCSMNSDINGKSLLLDQGSTLRPLEELFADNFMEGLHKHVKSTSEAPWTYQDYDDAIARVVICPIQSFGRPGKGRSTK